MHWSKRAEGLNDRWALHFLPLSFFLLSSSFPVSCNIDTRASIFAFSKTPTLAKPIFHSFLFFLRFFSFIPAPLKIFPRRKFIDDEISFCSVPIPSFLFTHFLFLDPAQRALNHPHTMDTCTHIWTCVHSEARMHVSSPLLSHSMCLSIHVATYIPTRAREDCGAVIPNHTCRHIRSVPRIQAR